MRKYRVRRALRAVVARALKVGLTRNEIDEIVLRDLRAAYRSDRSVTPIGVTGTISARDRVTGDPTGAVLSGKKP